MTKIFHHDCRRDMEQAGGPLLFAREPYAHESCTEAENKTSGSCPVSGIKPCGYLFFPGCRLCGAEPEIVVKIYDSILFQHPDTAILIDFCGSDAFHDRWLSLGKPTVVTPCTECMARLKEKFPDVKVLSLYRLLLDMKVSGGCNSAGYTMLDPEGDEEYPADGEIRADVIALAEDMGASVSRNRPNDDETLPYLTCCTDCRDSLKRHGKDAVHILELIYGMGDSNAHMEHKHDHDHDDHEGSHEKAPEPRNMTDASPDRHDPAAGLPSEDQRLANIRELMTIIPELMR